MNCELCVALQICGFIGLSASLSGAAGARARGAAAGVGVGWGAERRSTHGESQAGGGCDWQERVPGSGFCAAKETRRAESDQARATSLLALSAVPPPLLIRFLFL